MTYNIFDFEELLGDYKLVGVGTGLFTNIKTSDEADENSLVWINPTRKDKGDIFNRTKARLIICNFDEIFNPAEKQLLIEVSNPKLIFIRIIAHIFSQKIEWGIHPSAVVHPEAKIHPESYVGPNSYIGKCDVGKGTIIKGNAYIYDNTIISSNVLVHPGVVIGGDGFGYSKEEDGTVVKFPHIGGVVIEDDVEIGANTCIDRGALGNTLIKKGAKLDNLVYIAHNVIIGKYSFIIANAVIAGSTIIGDNCWVAPSATIRDAIKIGSNVTIGLGAVVTKEIPENETWVGSPAQELKEFMSIQTKLKNL